MNHSLEHNHPIRRDLSRLADPALWAWLLVALLALLPARAALHVILA